MQIYITNREAANTFELGLHLLHALLRLYPDEFAWEQGRDGLYFIDLLFGSDRPRRALQDGAEVADLMKGWPDALDEFRRKRQPFLLYDR